MLIKDNSEAIIVGSGLVGSVIARYLAEERGKKVVVWERRNHIGGNMYDYVDQHGILVQKYGPHVFHTNNRSLCNYLKRFIAWQDYQLICLAEIDGITTPTPFNFQTIDDFYPLEQAMELKAHIQAAFGKRQTATVMEVLENEDPLIQGYAQFLFAKDYSLYAAKQWGVSPKMIDPSILKRVPLRFSYDVGYFDDQYQMMPKVSYTAFFEKILDHPNITLNLGKEALKYLSVSTDGKTLLREEQPISCPVIYTGALDELFGCNHGSLPYRSLRFEWKYENKKSIQAAPVVAYPQAKGYTRITEYKKLPKQAVKGSTYAVEYPLPYKKGKKLEPYYPLLTEESQKQHAAYQKQADKIPNLYYCGRLADFKYYNMDQALERALEIAKVVKID